MLVFVGVKGYVMRSVSWLDETSETSIRKIRFLIDFLCELHQHSCKFSSNSLCEADWAMPV